MTVLDNKMLTYELIVNSFKKLMKETGFQKITVKMIAGESGIMRSTFYNYFQDKYEILEWIVDEDILSKVSVSTERKKYSNAARDLFKCVAEDKVFYKKAFEITGQNGFEEILVSKVMPLFVEAYESVNFDYPNSLITRENMAHYQSLALVEFLKMWLCENCFADAESDDVCEAFVFMLTQGNSFSRQSTGLAALANEIKKAIKKS